jgi:hypothetical protein
MPANAGAHGRRGMRPLLSIYAGVSRHGRVPVDIPEGISARNGASLFPPAASLCWVCR